MEVRIVIVPIETAVVTATAEERIVVSSPIFSAWIIGRFPTGTAAMRHMASVATGSKFKACMTRTMLTGTRIMRRKI